jgi:predicted short-subunit dehydrogenase-like oxidoreductase (DUF2520 family)
LRPEKHKNGPVHWYLTFEPKEFIGIAGAGRVARAFGRLLVDAGEPVICVASRDIRNAAKAAEFMGPDVRPVRYPQFPDSVCRLLIAVPDRALTEVAAALPAPSNVRVALHTCGARGPEALAALHARGIDCGTVHPLQTVGSGSVGAAALQGIAFAVWGDPAAVEWAERIAALANGEVLRIPPEFRPLYHAAAVMTSNYVMALLDAGRTLLEQCGVDSSTALRALGPLFRTSLENALERGPVEALTGPIERGDVETVAAHLTALAAAPERIRNLYRAAGLQTVHLARRRGLDDECVREFDHLLERE